MDIEQQLIQYADLYPPWLVMVSLFVAALSFLARHWAQYHHGRIREYGPTALGVVMGLLGLALLYGFVSAGAIQLSARPVVTRILLSLLSVALVAFNWGGVRVAVRDFVAVFRKERGS